MTRTHTYSYAVLPVSRQTYDEIRRKLEAAELTAAFHRDGREEHIDMHGLALTPEVEARPDQIMIGIPSGEMSRWAAFYGALVKMDLPPNVRLSDIEPVRGCSAAQNRNQIVQKALAEGYDRILFLDDDLIVRRDALLRLLARQEDIVIGLSYSRDTPYRPLWWNTPPDPETRRVTLLEIGDIRTDGELQPICGGTSGGMLVSTRVFRGVAAPWWTLGQFVSDEWHDDVWFCELARAAGFRIYGDPTVRFGHITNVEVWPYADDADDLGVLLARGPKPVAFMKP